MPATDAYSSYGYINFPGSYNNVHIVLHVTECSGSGILLSVGTYRNSYAYIRSPGTYDIKISTIPNNPSRIELQPFKAGKPTVKTVG